MANLTLGAGFEPVNRAVDPIFSNTSNADLAIFTETSNQAVHIGVGMDGSRQSTVRITSSNVEVNGNVMIDDTSGLYHGSYVYPRVSVLQYTYIDTQDTTFSMAADGLGGNAVIYPLNTIVENELNLTLSSNTFTLSPGVYEITANLHVTGNASRNRVYLLNATTNTVARMGTTTWDSIAGTNAGISETGFVYAKLTLTTETSFRFMARGNGTTLTFVRTADGFANNVGALVIIKKFI